MSGCVAAVKVNGYDSDFADVVLTDGTHIGAGKTSCDDVVRLIADSAREAKA